MSKMSMPALEMSLMDPDATPVTPRKQIVSLDVEYYPKNPTQVSIVAEDGKVLFNYYFDVPDSIKIMMSNKKRKHLRGKRLLHYPMWKPTIESILKDKIVVGHDIKLDFDALGINVQDYEVIDTSVIKEYMATVYLKRSLKNLAHNFLKKNIQKSSSHDALEDARAALELIKLYQRKSSENADLPDLIEFIHPKTAANYAKNMEGLTWNDLPPVPEPNISSFVSPYQNSSMPTYNTTQLAAKYAKNMEGLSWNDLPPVPEPNISSFVSPYQNLSMPTYNTSKTAANYAKNMEGLSWNGLPAPTQSMQNFIGVKNNRNTKRKPLYARAYNKLRKTLKR